MTQPSPAPVERALAQASDGIGAARTLLNQGNAVDLSGLEAQVHTLCHAIAATPLDQRGPLKQRLVALIDDLGALADALNAHHQRLTAELRERMARTKASAAYGPGRNPGPRGNAKK